MSTLYTDNIRANNASQITLPTGQKIVGTDAGSIVAPGQIVQIVNNVLNNNGGGNSQVLSASNSSVEITGLATTITPKLAGSHFLIQCNVMHGMSPGNGWMHCKFSRDVNSTYQAEILENSWYGKDQYGGGIETRPWFNCVDTGASYSVGDTITYKFYGNTQNNTSLYINWNNNGINHSTSSVTVMEIAQ